MNAFISFSCLPPILLLCPFPTSSQIAFENSRLVLSSRLASIQRKKGGFFDFSCCYSSKSKRKPPAFSLFLVGDRSLRGMEREWRVNPDCVNASNPFHVCAEYCVQRAHVLKPRSPRPKLVVAAQNGERREGDRGMVDAERNVDPSCRNVSNPYHQCAEYCSPRSPQVKELNGQKRSEDSVVKMEGNQEKKEEMEHKEGGNSIVPAQNEERCKENRGIVVAERIVDPSCPNASNPFHQCAEYCSPRNPEEKRQREKQSEIGVRMENNRMVDPRCVNASNPYHVCAEYCFQKMKEMKQTEGGKAVVATHNERREGLKIDVREGVHPSCINASNPYHKCAEYCFEKINQLM